MCRVQLLKSDIENEQAAEWSTLLPEGLMFFMPCMISVSHLIK
jgi:hypothetical protein